MTQYRLELERARDNIFRIFNEANEGTDTDIQCRAEQPTGSRMRQDVCRSNAENRAHSEAGRSFLHSLFINTQGFNTNGKLGFGSGLPAPVYANIGTGNAEQAGKAGEASAIAEFEKEFNRVLSDNRDLFRAVTTYAELEAEYAQARGATTELAEQEVFVLEPAPVPAQANGPLCEASSLTEYQQHNTVARVSGTVSLSNCPAGTTGGFTVVARVRNDAGETNAFDFNETWQRADADDHIFKAEYPIGDNVFLASVRVRDLKCTCAGPAP